MFADVCTYTLESACALRAHLILLFVDDTWYPGVPAHHIDTIPRHSYFEYEWRESTLVPLPHKSSSSRVNVQRCGTMGNDVTRRNLHQDMSNRICVLQQAVRWCQHFEGTCLGIPFSVLSNYRGFTTNDDLKRFRLKQLCWFFSLSTA